MNNSITYLYITVFMHLDVKIMRYVHIKNVPRPYNVISKNE